MYFRFRDPFSVLSEVFVDTKRGADHLCRELRYMQHNAAALHGDKEQRVRDRILADFRTGKVPALPPAA